mmetsp:Transcript_50630/g.158186  ORF Transcript_50630/g.158186 Transcript_50630/m.158186 type:complete len:206 (+) Transcript_50630:2819-3436(+)
MALSQRLMRHWRRRKLSPTSAGSISNFFCFATSTAKSTLRMLTRAERMSQRSSQMSVSRNGCLFSSIAGAPSPFPFPVSESSRASSFAYSSTWLIMPSRASAEVREDFTYSRWRGSSSSASRRSELKAMTELRGVRSSWLMLATKRRERRAEVSASTHAICSARFITSARTTAVCFESRSDLSCATRSVATVSSRQKFPDMSATE